MDRRVALLIVLIGVCWALADASQVVHKLKTRVRAPPLTESSESASDSTSESGSVESIAATKLQGSQDGCESSNPCSSPIQWGSVSGSSSSNAGDTLGSVEEVVDPISAWIKAFKKRIGAGENDLVGAARAIVSPLIEKLKANQKRAQEKLEESNEAIIDTVQRSVTEHVLKLLKAEKIQEDKEEQSEAKRMKQESAQEEAAEKEELRRLESAASESLSSLASSLSSSLSSSQ